MSKTIKKYGLIAAICTLVCCMVGAVCTVMPGAQSVKANAALTLAVKEAKSIRVADDGHNGIRFTATIENYSSEYEYHIVIVPEDYTSTEKGYVSTGDHVADLTAVINGINTANNASITLNDQACTPGIVGEETVIKGSITNIQFNNSLRDFVAFAYAKPLEGEATSADYIYSAISSPVNVTELSAKLLTAGEGVLDAKEETALNGYVDTGIKKAADLQATDEVPALTVSANNVSLEAGNAANLALTVKNGEETVSGLDFLVTGITTEATGITYENGVVSTLATVLTRTATATVASVGNRLASAEFIISVNQPEKNIFAPVYMQSDFGYGWTPLDADGALTREYDTTEGAVKVTMIGTNTNVYARSYVLFLTLDEIKYAISQGNTVLEFKVKGAADSEICIYNKVKSTTDNKDNVYLDDNNIDRATSAKIYSTVALTTEYTTVKVNLADFMALNTAGEFIGICVKANAGETIYFKDAEFRGISSDIFNDEHSWAVINNTVTGVGYDVTESATKISLKTAQTADNARDYVAFVSATAIREQYDAGKKALTFTAKADAAISINLFAKQTSTRDNGQIKNETAGVLVYGAFDLTNEYAQYTIDLNEFFAAKGNEATFEANYFAFVIYGAVGNVYIKDATYLDKFPTEPNVFSEKHNWSVINNTVTGVGYDATESATKISLKTAQTANNARDYVAFVSATAIREQYDAGKKALTFTAKADAAISINLFAKQTSTRDNGQIKNETAGVLVYGAFDLTTSYATYTISLDKFFAAKGNEAAFEANYFAMVIFGAVGNVYIKDATYQDTFVDGVDYSQMNLFGADYKWIAPTATYTQVGYDTSNGAVKVTVLEGAAYTDNANQFTSNSRRILMSTEIFAQAKASGYTTFTFEYYSELTGDNNYGFRVCANNGSYNASMSNSTVGIVTHNNGGELVTGVWTTVEIDLADLFAEADNVQGISIVPFGKPGSTIMFRNGSFAKA